MERTFALIMVIMLLFTTFLHGVVPISAATMKMSDVKAGEQDTEPEKEQKDLPIQHEQPKQLTLNKSFQVEVSMQEAEEIVLLYKQDVDSEEIELPMEPSENTDRYTAVIPGEAISGSNLEYWFEVTNEEESITSLPYIVDVIEEKQETQKEEDQDAKSVKELAIEHEAVTNMDGEANVTLKAKVKNAENVILQFETGEQMAVQELSFTKDEGTNNYTVAVPTEYIWSDQFQYNIIAQGEDGQELTYPEEGYIEATVQTEEPETQGLPPVLITEIASQPDGYGFIEIYNNSDHSINVKDYQLSYQEANNETDQVMDLTEDKVIPSKETFIIWTQDKARTIDEFNTNFDAALTEDRLTIIESSLANNHEQTIAIRNDAGEEIVSAAYHKQDQDNQTSVFQYPSEQHHMRYVGLGETATPLALIHGQVPSKPVEIETADNEEEQTTNTEVDKEINTETDRETNAPSNIETDKKANAELPIMGEPSISLTDEVVTVEMEVTSDDELKEVLVHVSQSSALTEQVLPMELAEDSIYKLTIPRSQIWNEQIQYHFTASIDSDTVTTKTYEAVIPQPSVDPQTMPKLLVTELVPDTVNRNGADAYEFIEVYNNTDQPINMKDYQIIYRYPTETADQTWDITDDKMIASQESFIIWIHNDGNQQATLDDFNQQYGLELTEDQVAIVSNSGMANGSERTLIVADEFGNEIVQASYNDGTNDVFTDQGIMYKYPEKGVDMQKVGVAESVSPLTVFPEQVPQDPVKVQTEAELPEIGEPDIDVTDEEITMQLEVTSEQALQGVNLYVSQAESMGFDSVMMEETETAGIYMASIPRTEIWSNKLHYYIVASNQAGKATSEHAEFDLPQAQIDYQSVPSLFITEVVPDSTNANGSDAYEFIEVYNNTTEAINYQDYTVRYRYPNTGPAGDVLWNTPSDQKDIMIPSGETVVFWIINSGNPDLTSVDFNNHYGTNLTEGANLIKIYNSGMSNSAERSLVMATKSGDELSNVTYMDEVGVDDTIANKGVLFRYPSDGSQSLRKISAGALDATPGEVMPEQIPEEKVQLAEDTVQPNIEDTTGKETITSEEAAQITATITDDIRVKSVSLFYRTMAGESFRQVNLERQTDNTYEHTIYEPELIGQQELEYYFEASDGRNQSSTEIKTIPIEHENVETGLRLNVEEDELLAGEKVIKATEDAYTENLQLFLDNELVTDTFMAMEKEAYFAFDVSETNIYFKNGVTMGDEILEIFDDTYTDFVTLTVPIPPDMLAPGENTITIRAGNKVSPFDETSAENRDDFTIKNVRLVLEDGTVIYDPDYSNPETNYAIGDSTGKDPVYDFHFTLDQDKFASLAYLFDTTTVADGTHEIKAALGDDDTTANVIVDNTAPVIKPSIEEGKEFKGDFTIHAGTEDASDVEVMTATLDGGNITLPYETSSAQLSPGEHEVIYTATDAAGNTGTETVTFLVAEEHPWLPDWMESQPDAVEADLSVKVNDPTGDKMKVDFYQSYQYTSEDTENLTISQNSVSTEPPGEFSPEGETHFTEGERTHLTDLNGKEVVTESTTEFPYHRFDVTVDENVQPDDEIEMVWNGSSLEGRKVTMYAWNHTTNGWDELTSVIAGEKAFELIGSVTGEAYLQDGKVSVIVQDQIANPGEDFTFVWMSDTQYYAESYPNIYQEQVDWIAANQEELNLEYVIHTGDIVNIWDDFDQWEVGDKSMKVLDDANIPYGVLAGNHDVDQKDNNYTNYYTYFGDHRFADRPYFAGSYENNRGHYDLISVNGNDFIIAYMGWGVDQAGIDWLNNVLEEHPNHKAILGFHEYLLASGTRGPIGDELFEKVVVPNENVQAVLSGHYHNSQKLIDEIDDDGDGVAERTVYQLLADYQGGPEGGQGYMRLLNFNMETNQMEVQTYSPYMDEYNYYDPEEHPEKDAFNLDWDLEPQLKKVATDYVEVNVYTDHLIDSVEQVDSGATATAVWENLAPNSEYFWYVIVTDDFGGKVRSDIWSFQTIDGEIIEPPEPEVPEVPNPEEPGENPDDENGEDTGGVNDGDSGADENNKNPDEDPNEALPNNKKQTILPEVQNNQAILDDNVFHEIISDGNIIVDLNAYADLTIVELKLMEEQVDLIKEKNIMLTIQKGDLSLDIPASAFNESGDVIIKVERLKQIEDALSNVYDITVTQDDTQINQFAEPITFTLDVFTDKVTIPEHLHLYYSNEDVKEWELVNGSEFANNQVTAPVHHLSIFAAFEEIDEHEESTPVMGDQSDTDKTSDSEGKGSNADSKWFMPNTATNMFNYLSIGLLLIIIGVCIWFIRFYRRQRSLDG
ncbi:lamin tail domain-containing protein [Gracilibacillus timonensis]|uniref:lamin tail domain-containing protein n=1 Tax=Gracilibacillus timonensis TaxID=1816696 RepID=UPI000827093B|nr:lamin tail domain-containing protein [Gracilibacillus timonensis]